MTNDEQNALRVMLREEVNAAVYASEQRLGERLDRVDARLDKLEAIGVTVGERLDKLEVTGAIVVERLDKLEVTGVTVGKKLDRLDERLSRVETVQKQMAVNLAQVASVLDEATIKINELQMSQIALEQKLEENTGTLKRDMQKLTYTVHSFMDNVTDSIGSITLRLNMHKDTPIDEAHPHSAA
jgi:DNA repair ATPase RecN